MRVVISESSGAIENTHRPANLYTCSFISFTIKNYITVTISLETGGGGGCCLSKPLLILPVVK